MVVVVMPTLQQCTAVLTQQQCCYKFLRNLSLRLQLP